MSVLAAVPVAAQTDPGFEIGVEVFDYGYHERDQGSIIVRDRGTFVGLSARYVQPLGDSWSLSARADGANAKVDYRSDDGARLDNVSQSVGRLELVLARDIPLGRSTVLTPSLGIGARLLEDRSGNRVASDGAAGYDREVFYGYLPVGITLSVPAGGAKFSIGGRYAWLLDGTSDSRLSQVDPALPNVKLDLDGGRLVEAEATLAIPAGRHAIVVSPFVRRWTTNRSKSITVTLPDAIIEFAEPRTRTTEAGARFSFRF